MSKSTIIGTATGKLRIAERCKNSVNGNPRFLIAIGDTLLYTKPNASLAYGIQNDEGRAVKATIVSHYGRACIDTYEVTES